MVLVRKSPKSYPTKTIIQDMLERRTPAGPDDWSPFDGQADEFDRQFPPNSSARIWMDIPSFLELRSNRDFDPRSVRGSKQKVLEDYNGDSTAAAAYFASICTGYKKTNESPYIQRKGTTFEKLIEDEDTGNMVYGSDLHVDFEEEETSLNTQQLFDKLTYLVKQIWQESIRCKASLFSFAFAYYQFRNDTHISTKSFRPFADACKLLKVHNGTLSAFVHEDDQKYTIYPAARSIFLDKSNPRVYRMCDEFLQILVELGFDPAKEDPWKYDAEFCTNLPCMYVETETEFTRGEAFMRQILHEDVDSDEYFYPIDIVEGFGYISRIHGLANIVLNAIRTSDDGVAWERQLAYCVLEQIGAVPTEEVERDNAVAKMMPAIKAGTYIKDGIVYDKDKGVPYVIDGQLHSANSKQFRFYILSSGDLIAMFMNKITLEVKSLYSIMQKGDLGNGRAHWRRLDGSEVV